MKEGREEGSKRENEGGEEGKRKRRGMRNQKVKISGGRGEGKKRQGSITVHHYFSRSMSVT